MHLLRVDVVVLGLGGGARQGAPVNCWGRVEWRCGLWRCGCGPRGGVVGGCLADWSCSLGHVRVGELGDSCIHWLVDWPVGVRAAGRCGASLRLFNVAVAGAVGPLDGCRLRDLWVRACAVVICAVFFQRFVGVFWRALSPGGSAVVLMRVGGARWGFHRLCLVVWSWLLDPALFLGSLFPYYKII